MKSALSFLTAFFLLCCSTATAQLSRQEADTTIADVFEKLAGERKAEMGWKVLNEEPRMEQGSIKAADKELKCVSIQYGDADYGQRSLYISMHGGGGTAAFVNDGQWKNQVDLYQPKEGFYVAPRAPTDSWNMWHQGHIDLLFARLIENFVATRGVHPGKVYLLGYSAGGDGVYQLAPRLADRFAAASMMAGHPNSATADGLRNLPFRIYMGGKDAAFNRNKTAADWKLKLEALQEERGGYEHKVTIFPEFGHWMQLKDAEAIPWMATKQRNSWPKHVVWGKSNPRSKRFYWLEGIPAALTTAKVDGQSISITGSGDAVVTLRLNDQLLDLDQPVSVSIDGKDVWQGRVERTKASIEESLSQRLDPDMAATATLIVKQAE